MRETWYHHPKWSESCTVLKAFFLRTSKTEKPFILWGKLHVKFHQIKVKTMRGVQENACMIHSQTSGSFGQILDFFWRIFQRWQSTVRALTEGSSLKGREFHKVGGIHADLDPRTKHKLGLHKVFNRANALHSKFLPSLTGRISQQLSSHTTLSAWCITWAICIRRNLARSKFESTEKLQQWLFGL